MKKKFFLLKVIILYLFIIPNGYSKNQDFFQDGKIFFDKKKYDESKVFFEKDIVFNPKNEKSYLYLAKIFKEQDNDEEEEMNLNSVLLLDPKNDEAIYLLILLKIKQSDYYKTRELIEKFDIICVSFCSKKKEIKEKFSKLTPTNEKN